MAHTVQPTLRPLRRHLAILLLAGTLACLLSACRSSAPAYNYRQLARAGIALGVDIGAHDNHRLYIESARWLGTPHRTGGNSHRGIDCSGFTRHIYNKVYRKKLERNSNAQLRHNCRRIPKRQLQEGDLVFFHNNRSRRTATHVGIYLKDNLFVHASTSRGVVVDHLDEAYYKRRFLAGGRVK